MIVKRVGKKSTIKASNSRMAARRRSIRASEEDEVVEDEVAVGDVNVAPEASDLLFEAEDVAQLVSEVTGEEVTVTADENEVKFEVGEDEFVVTAEGDEELLEASTRVAKGKRSVKAATAARQRRVLRKGARR